MTRQFQELKIISLNIAMIFSVLGCNEKHTSSSEAGPRIEKSKSSIREIRIDKPKDPIESLKDYFTAQGSEDRDRILKDLGKSLDLLSEDELSRIAGRYGSSEVPEEIVYTWQALEALLKKNPRLALDLFAKTKGLEGGAGTSFLQSAVASNESVVLEWLSTVHIADSKFIIRPAMWALAKKNPTAALSLIRQQTDSGVATSMVKDLFRVMPGGASEAAKMAVANLPAELASNALLSIAARYSTKSPKEALAILNTTSNAPIEATDEAYQKVFEGLFKEDSNYAIQSIANLDPAAIQSVLSSKSCLEQAIALNPSAAIESMGKIVMTSSNSQIFKDASFFLADKDPQMAFEWVGSFPESKTKQDMLQTAVRIWGEKDPLAASGVIDSLPGNEKNEALKGLAEGWSLKLKSFQESVDWSLQLPKNERSIFLESGLSNLSGYHPEEAAEFLKQGMMQNLDAISVESTFYKVAQNLLKRNLAQTVAWVSELPSNSQPGAVRGVIDAWVAVDPGKASQWLGELPAGPARDAGVEALASKIQDTDPVSAQKWRDSVSSKTTR
jgi:hypothetical protein